MKNEQFYKALGKTKLNYVIYKILKEKYVVNNLKPLPIQKESIELIRKDSKSSSLITRDNCWQKSEYNLDIIVPVYNTGVFLEDCIQSVLTQNTKYNYKLFIINDGSTDRETLLTLKKYESDKSGRIVNIHVPNGGIAAARNIGIDKSLGSYLMFLDSDDILMPDAIEGLLSRAIEENADIVEGAYNNVSEKNAILKQFPHSTGTLSGKNDMYGYAWGKVYKRELFSQVRFPEYNFEDSIVKSILIQLADKKIGIKNVVYGYRRNRKSVSFLSQNNPKSLDSYWITSQINKDRKVLGISNEQSYYEYMLNMVKLTFRRNIQLEDKYIIDLFDRICDDMEEFSEYKTQKEGMKDLETAIRTRNFGLFRLWNTMNMF